MEQFFTIDWSEVPQAVIEGLQNGSMRYSNANNAVYWAQGSGNTGIVKHLPFIPSNLEKVDDLVNVSKAIQAAQNIQLAATALSTGLIIGAIVIQTMYLSSKIDKLQATIDIVSQDIHSQNIIFYMSKVADYFGAVETARIYMQDRTLKEEVRELATQVVVDLATRRNQLFNFIDNIIVIANSDSVSERHKSLIIDFVNISLELLPKGIFIERELNTFIDKYATADLVTGKAAQRYLSVVDSYRRWCNAQNKESAKGKIGLLINEKDNDLKTLFKMEENKLLLPILQS